MFVVIDGKLYDSTVTPILLVLHPNEKEMFNMNRFVSAPESSTVEERQNLIDMDLKELILTEVEKELFKIGGDLDGEIVDGKFVMANPPYKPPCKHVNTLDVWSDGNHIKVCNDCGEMDV